MAVFFFTSPSVGQSFLRPLAFNIIFPLSADSTVRVVKVFLLLVEKEWEVSWITHKDKDHVKGFVTPF
jgi:hypothetical protein